jgi:uncharacterized damage-inducible protein DinB
MSLQKLMSNYADYNLWSNKTLVEWLKTKPAESLEKEIPSSFPGIIATIVHIWDTERFWLSILQETPPPPSFRMNGYSGTSEEALSGIVEHSTAFSNYIRSSTDETLLQESYLDTPWVKGQLPKYEFVQHAFNHSTYHRGQVITIGRNLGFTDAPMTDYNFYNMVTKKN